MFFEIVLPFDKVADKPAIPAEGEESARCAVSRVEVHLDRDRIERLGLVASETTGLPAASSTVILTHRAW